MKKILTIFLLICSLTASATTYYVKTGGSDVAAGTSDATAWATITKVNAVWAAGTFNAGDNILFRRGDTWYGTIVPGESGTSGTPITVGAYGTGNKPIIEGFTTLSSWTRVGTTSVYYASATFEVAPEMLIFNGYVREKGRYPNAGYNTISTVVTGSPPPIGNPITITDATLPSTPDWDGAEIVVRYDHWTILKSTITNHTGTSLTFNTSYFQLPAAGWGYFIQNHPGTLTGIGDWYYDAVNGRIYMHFGSDVPAQHTIRVSTLQYLVNNSGNSRQYVTVAGLHFRGSSNHSLRFYNAVSYINVTDCTIEYSGGDAIYQHGGTGSIIDGNTISYTNWNAINIEYSNGTTISDNAISYTGHYIGNYGTADGNYGMAIICAGGINNRIENNAITNTGYQPIYFGGGGSIVRYNYIDTYCYHKDDGAGIYIFNNRDGLKQINYNIVLNAMGAGAGTNDPTHSSANGLYTDGGTANVSLTGNIVGNISGQGYHGNLPVNVTLDGNTFFQCGVFIGLWKFGYTFWWDGTSTFINGLNIQNNKFISTNLYKNLGQGIRYENDTEVMYGNDINDEIAHFGTWNNNYYYTNEECFIYMFHASYQTNAPYNLARWTTEFGHDANSTAVVPEAQYTLNSIGSNLLTNSTFGSNITGWSASSGDLTLAWDNTNQLGNGGSLKLTSTQANFYHWWWINTNAAVASISGGAISDTKHYLLRFLGKSAINNKTMAFRLYSTGTGSEIQRYFTVGNTNTQKDVLLSYPANVSSGASLRIVAGDDPVITYLDNVGLYEANVTLIDADDYLHLIYNETAGTKYFELSTTMTDVTGAEYSGTIGLGQWESLVLIGAGTVTEGESGSPSGTSGFGRVGTKFGKYKGRFTGIGN